MHPRLHNLLLTTAALLALGAAPAAGGRGHGRRRSRAGAVPVVRTKNYRCRFRYPDLQPWSCDNDTGVRRLAGVPPRAGTLTMRVNYAGCGKQRPHAAPVFQIAQSERPDAPWTNEFSGKVRFFLVDSRQKDHACTLSGLRLVPSLGTLTVWMHLFWSGVMPGMGSMP